MAPSYESIVCRKCGEECVVEIPDDARDDVYFKVQREIGTVCPDCLREARTKP